MSEVHGSGESSVATDSSRKRAKAWLHFDEVIVDLEKKAECRYCHALLVRGSNSGTTHLNRHIDTSCRLVPEEVRETFKSMLNEGKDDVGHFIFHQDTSRNLLVKFFVSAEIPFRVGENRYFREFLKSVQPKFKCIGRKTLRDASMELFQASKEKLIEGFATLQSNVCFTADLWTSDQNLGYICVTSHYIDEKFILQKKILAFRQVTYPHTAFAIQDSLGSCLREYGLVSKTFTITVDNASANDKAIKDLGEELKRSLPFGDEHLHVRCGAHILNILVQDGMKVMRAAIEKLRDLIRTIDSSPSRMQAFNEVAQKLNHSPKRGLILDVLHRWNSTFDMLSEAFTYKDVLCRYAMEQNLSMPSPVDWKDAQLLCNFLGAFNDATKTFSVDRRPSSHLYMHEILGIRDVLMDESLQSSDLLKNMSCEMQKKFNKYWTKPNRVLVLAVVLDPRAKHIFLKFCCDIAYGKDSQVSKENFEKMLLWLKEFFDKYASITKNQTATPSQCSQGQGISSVGSPVLGKRKVSMQFELYRPRSRARPNQSELDSYLAEDLVSNTVAENFDILDWWSKTSKTYPVLAMMARDFLVVPVSSVSSESAFSAAGRLLDNNRNIMIPDTLEAQVCVKDWLVQSVDEDDSATC